MLLARRQSHDHTNHGEAGKCSPVLFGRKRDRFGEHKEVSVTIPNLDGTYPMSLIYLLSVYELSFYIEHLLKLRYQMFFINSFKNNLAVMNLLI